MRRLVRFGVSLEDELLRRFDKTLRASGYKNRSKAISDLVREKLIEKEWEEGGEVVGVISMLYDHHQRELSRKLTSLQHEHYRTILSSQHIHLDRHLCLEVVVARGEADEVRKLADLIAASRGVKHVKLSMSSTGENI